MRVKDGIEFSTIYASFISALALYFGVYEFLKVFTPSVPYLFLVTTVALYPILPLHDRLNITQILFITMAFLGALGIAISNVYIPADIMGGFVLILSASLILTGLKDTYRMLYSGLSFYIVGLFLLLGDAVITAAIILADVTDYYINCIGESCSQYIFLLRPEIIMLILAPLALYPFFKRNSFKRRVK